MSHVYHLPEDPCQRLIEMNTSIGISKRRLQGWGTLRYAVLNLVTCGGDPEEICAQLHETAEGLRKSSGIFSSLRSDLRYCISGTLTRHGISLDSFRSVLEPTRSWFREERLPKGEIQEVMACLILMEEAADDRPTRDQVARMAEIYAGMKSAHRFLTGRDDLAMAALLSTKEQDVESILDRIRETYEGLRELRFWAGNQLQLASHMLALSEEDASELTQRFRRLYTCFKEKGLQMGSGDYDEVAVLSLLPHAADTIVKRVLDDRELLRAQLEPRPSRQQGFDLAATTAFLALAIHTKAGEPLLDATSIGKITSMVASGSAVIAAAAAAGAAAAS